MHLQHEWKKKKPCTHISLYLSPVMTYSDVAEVEEEVSELEHSHHADSASGIGHAHSYQVSL